MKTPISYYGGKQTMLKHILPLVPRHKLYTEAFCGGCAVLFAKPPVAAEIINDLNGELINFYCVAKSYAPLLVDQINLTLHARDHYDRANAIYTAPDNYTPIERAWAVWALSKLSFASQLGGSFGFDLSGTTAKKVRNAKDNFSEMLCRRLDRVTIENQDALRVIARYDCTGAFHFVDPPYVGSDCGHYANTFGDDDLLALLELLSGLKGKFMLTMFPNEVIKGYIDRYGWLLHRVERTITASKSAAGRRKQEEWIVCNYAHPNQSLTLF
ncbi:MAG: DNA adenine methylase [Mucinivorans sp.]